MDEGFSICVALPELASTTSRIERLWTATHETSAAAGLSTRSNEVGRCDHYSHDTLLLEHAPGVVVRRAGSDAMRSVGNTPRELPFGFLGLTFSSSRRPGRWASRPIQQGVTCAMMLLWAIWSSETRRRQRRTNVMANPLPWPEREPRMSGERPSVLAGGLTETVSGCNLSSRRPLLG